MADSFKDPESVSNPNLDVSHGDTMRDEEVRTSRPLFVDANDPSFDREVQGGLLVGQDGRLIELRHARWVAEDTPIGMRARRLPYRLNPNGSLEATYHTYDPAAPTRGAEIEIAVNYDGEPYAISPDGRALLLPDGSRSTLQEHSFDFEALKCMLEFSTEVAQSDEEHRANVIERVYQVERWLGKYSLTHSGLALFPYDFALDDLSSSPYVQAVIHRNPQIREFGVMSNQITMQAYTPEAAKYALNEYQVEAAALSFITQAAPIRDGKFTTTFAEHYGIVGQETADEAAGRKKAAYLAQNDFDFLQTRATRPSDWRELARFIGSPSAGTFRLAAPIDLRAFLELADKQLRNGDIVVSGRTLGQHTDRFRAESGRIEICNLAPAGGNLYKVLATQELVVKYFVAKQLEHERLSPKERQRRIANHQRATEYGHINNIAVSLYGRNAPLRRFDGSRTSIKQTVHEMIGYTNANNPVPLSAAAEYELRSTAAADLATLSLEHYRDPSEVFSWFFAPGSGMTATEALQLAFATEPCREMEERIAVQSLLAQFSEARREHVYHIRETARRTGLLTALT